MGLSIQIFDDQTVEGASEEFILNGQMHIVFKGTFDGASIQLQQFTGHSNDSGFSTTGDAPLTAEQEVVFLYGTGFRYRFYLSDEGASTSISAFRTI